MGLLNKLTSGQSKLTSLNGTTPPTPIFKQSTLHKDYSLNGIPTAMQVTPKNGKLPQPSILDPNQPRVQYIQNLPR